MRQVYFMRAATGHGPIKIGTSSFPAGRARSLSSEMKKRVAVLATAPGSYSEERLLHRVFAADRVKGEWFTPTPRLLALVGTVLATQRLPDPAELRSAADKHGIPFEMSELMPEAA